MPKIILEPADQSREILSKSTSVQEWLGIDDQLDEADAAAAAAAFIYIFEEAFENPEDDFDKFIEIFPIDETGGTRIQDGAGSMEVYKYTVGTKIRIVELSDVYPKEAQARVFISAFESILQEFLENASVYITDFPKKNIRDWRLLPMSEVGFRSQKADINGKYTMHLYFEEKGR